MLLLGWPFHPTGFALAHAFLAMTWVWFPMLMGWAAKAIILRYGGMKLYRAWIPFFLGLLLGDVVIGVLAGGGSLRRPLLTDLLTDVADGREKTGGVAGGW
jgi:hypothetical protein